MFWRFFRTQPNLAANQPTDRVIQLARLWQRWLRWLAWLLPVLISAGVYLVVWYWLVLPGQSLGELRQASNLVIVSTLISFVLGIVLYRIQSILAQQVATSVELERLVEDRTQHITEVMVKLNEQNKALLALDQQKSEFVTLVSHELRAPLTNINGGLEVLLSRNQALPDSTRETLKLVAAEAGRLTRFVETILNVSALESGQLPVVLVPVRVDAPIKHILGQFSNLPIGHLQTRLEKNLPLVLADEHYLQSVLFHLLDNALKYAPDSPVLISAWSDSEQVIIEVKDRGPGIPAEAAVRLFDKFERLDALDSQATYGYGLGLYMCKRIMQALHGQIVLKSNGEPGAAFELRLPIWNPAVPDELDSGANE